MSELTFERWQIRDRGFVRLPNTIDEDRFVVSAADLAAREANERPTFLISARLVENLKGIINFFSALSDAEVQQSLFLIAGDGPDRAAIADYIDRRGLGEHVRLLGHCESDALVSLYRRANAFLLPSLSDQSPLTLVEALAMQLPVLVSNRCGNHFEAVVDGENGYLFDPYDREAMASAYRTFMQRRDEWSAMGRVSSALYDATFNRRAAIARFTADLTAFSAAQRSP